MQIPRKTSNLKFPRLYVTSLPLVSFSFRLELSEPRGTLQVLAEPVALKVNARRQLAGLIPISCSSAQWSFKLRVEVHQRKVSFVSTRDHLQDLAEPLSKGGTV